MIKKLLCFTTIGAAAFFGYHYPVLSANNENDPELQKNLFTGTYTLKVPSEGMELKLDKRHEVDMANWAEVIKNAKKIDNINADAQKDINEKMSELVKQKMKF